MPNFLEISSMRFTGLMAFLASFSSTSISGATLNPVVTADLIDMYALVESMIKDYDNFRWSDLLLHLNAGAEINLIKVISARAGVNRGFMSVGAGIWLPFAQVDVAYGWQEFGDQLGDKPVDCVTVKFNLGYDNK